MTSSPLQVCGLALALTACATVPASTPVPRVVLETLELLPSDDVPKFRVTVLIDNLEDIEIPVTELNFSARLSGEGVLSGVSREAFTVPALGSERVEIDIASDRVSSRQRLLAVADAQTRMLPYELDGALVVGGRPPRSLTFNYRGSVRLALGAER